MTNVYIVLFLLCGTTAGACFHRRVLVQTLAGRLMTGAIFLLVFSLGSAVGSNRMVLDNLGRLGGEAVLLCVGGLVGSLWLGRVVGPRLFPLPVRHDQ